MVTQYRSRTSSYRHQDCALAKMASRHGGALLMEPGTGKSKVAIDFCGRMHSQKGLERVLIIAPLSVLGVWEEEITKHLGEGVPRRVIRLRRNLPHKIKQIEEIDLIPVTITAVTNGRWDGIPISQRPSLTFVIINYESCWRAQMLAQLQKFDPQCVIVDESHRIKNPQALQSKGVYRFCDVRWKLILTGTPVTKSPLDIFGQWKFLKPEIFGENWFRFKNRYAVYGGYKNYEIVRFKNLDDIRRKVHHDAYFATKDECLDLPETVYQDIEVELETRLRKQYNEMERDFCLILQRGEVITAPIILTKMLRLSQLTGGFITDEAGVNHRVGSEKLHVIKDLLETYTYPARKVVVFARFLWEIHNITRIASECMLYPVVFTGEVPADKRDGLLRTFHEDPKCKVFIAQIATGGLGISLTAAQTAIFYSLDFDLGHYIQACDRLHRIGQANKVLYLHITAQETIDTIVSEALRTKQDLAELVTKYVQEKGYADTRRPRRRG